MKRICIVPKDVQWITGKSERQSRTIISTIKKLLGKQKHQAVTVKEFCNYMGIKHEEVEKVIK
jgi:hypothetical protein